MRILNQTAYDAEWLRERIVFGLGDVRPSLVRVMYLPHPTWPKDGKHIAGKTIGRYAGGGRYPGHSRIDIYLPHRFRFHGARLKSCGVSGLRLGRGDDADGLVFIVAHEAAHVKQCSKRRTDRERHCQDQEHAADLAGRERLLQWKSRMGSGSPS